MKRVSKVSDMAYDVQATLVAGLQQLGIAASDTQVRQLVLYLTQLQLWNKAYNLTAIRDPHDMVIKHVLDSLSILPHLPEGRLLDIGTGGGMPGYLIAIMQPHRPCVLMDSAGKKIRFLQQLTQLMQLSNVQAIHARVEDAQVQQQLGVFELITCRAFSSLTDLLHLSRPYLAANGSWYAMKGVVPSSEIEQIPQSDQVDISITPLQVPLLPEQRHLITITPAH